ncbi:uncharacterized protein LOC122275540 isoform X2 [Carya illinoinensis]|uniref:uncharacterized protein LOC122275540 isoform X2 n=1 Tax=Carya illinoinensis TaxID=32201 RepID=UPI001C720153|nr:uncharacterized protein LOC122275540 isoform X2 [Carya illinoinensis]
MQLSSKISPLKKRARASKREEKRRQHSLFPTIKKNKVSLGSKILTLYHFFNGSGFNNDLQHWGWNSNLWWPYVDTLLGWRLLISYLNYRQLGLLKLSSNHVSKPKLKKKIFEAVEMAQKSQAMDHIVLRKFGDEQSTLLDRFERLSFEVQLNQAILGRSFSEPSVARFQAPLFGQGPAPPPPPLRQAQRGRRGSAFHKVLKKFLKPILGRKSRGGMSEVQLPDPRNPRSWKAFSRSLRA